MPMNARTRRGSPARSVCLLLTLHVRREEPGDFVHLRFHEHPEERVALEPAVEHELQERRVPGVGLEHEAGDLLKDLPRRLLHLLAQALAQRAALGRLAAKDRLVERLLRVEVQVEGGFADAR